MFRSSLHKCERVKSRKLITSLFEHGKKVQQGPLLLFWKPLNPEEATAQLMFGVSVSKRKFKRAVDRNLIKRRIREAFRLQKVTLLEQLQNDDKSYALFVVYVGLSINKYPVIDETMKKMLKKWLSRINES